MSVDVLCPVGLHGFTCGRLRRLGAADSSDNLSDRSAPFSQQMNVDYFHSAGFATGKASYCANVTATVYTDVCSVTNKAYGVGAPDTALLVLTYTSDAHFAHLGSVCGRAHSTEKGRGRW